MDQVARLSLGGRRWQRYAKTLRFAGVDLTGADLRLQVRLYPNAPGAPLLDLATVTNGNAQGVRLIGVEQAGGVPVSTIGVAVNETAMEAMPFAGEPGDDSVFAYDLQIDPVGGYKQVWVEGEFWVLAAVTGADGATPAGGTTCGGQRRARPSFVGGTGQLSIGDSIVSVSVAGGEGPAGADGADAAAPDRVDFVAAAGQTRFPATGSLADLDPPFRALPRPLIVEVNGETVVPLTDYATIGTAPVDAIDFTSAMIGGEAVSLHAFKLEGDDPGTALKRMAFGIGKSAYEKLMEIVALDDVRTSSAADQDMHALAELIDGGYRRIRLRGGRGVGTREGEYRIGVGPWTNPELGSANPNDYTEHRGNLSTAAGAPAHGLALSGDGIDRTVIDQVDNYLFAHNSLSADPADNLRGFTIEDATLRGLGGMLEQDGSTNQNGHIVALAGVDGFRARRVRFFRQRADGVIGNMGPKTNTVRRQHDWGFDDCEWDGDGLPTRNGISIESVIGGYVNRCRFRRMGHATEPGCIDVEPIDRASYANQDWSFSGLRGEDLNYALLCLYLNNPDHYDVRAGQFLAWGIQVRRALRGFDLSGAATGELATVASRHQVSIGNFAMNDVEQPLRTAGMVDARIAGGTLHDVGSLSIGNNNGKANQEVAVTDLKISRGGRTNGAVVLVDDTTINCDLARVEMVECGIQTTTAGAGWGVLFRYGAAGLRVADVRVTNVAGRMKAFAQMGTGATLGTGAQKLGNELTPGSVAFTGQDNFNPPAPARGITKNYIFAANTVIAAGTPRKFDVTVPGSDMTKAWDATFDFNMGEAALEAAVFLSATTKEAGVVRLSTLTGGGNMDLSGRSITIRERV